MKKIIYSAVLTVIPMLLASCAKEIVEVHVTDVALDRTEATLMEGETLTLSATVSPNDAKDKTLIWSSTDETVATVSEGVVTAVSEGMTTIAATSVDGDISATCTVTVKPKVIAVESVSLDKSSLTITEGREASLTVTVKPENATNRNVTWTSSDENIASVEAGIITALKAGSATISAVSEDGGKTAECKVTVSAIGLTLDRTSLDLCTGEKFRLSASFTPDDAPTRNLTWSSSDDAVVSVSQDGEVTAVAEGTATVTVATEDGELMAECKVTVSAISLTLDRTSLDLCTGEKFRLSASFTPDDAPTRNLTWSSSDDAVVSVSQDGEVTAVAEGTATVTVATEDGELMAECKVIVRIPVQSVSLDKTTLQLPIGEKYLFTATIVPENATNSKMTWTSSDDEVVTVTDEGEITAIKAGAATITVTTEDGGKTAECAVEAIFVPVESVTLDYTELELDFEETFKLTATIHPENATNKNVNWSCNNYMVASVDQNGTIKTLSPHPMFNPAIITVTTEDGNKRAQCVLNVVDKGEPVKSISLDKSSVELKEGEEVTLKATILPNNATNKSISWSSSDNSVATVKDGRVYAITAGSAIITATTADGGKTATCSVTVLPGTYPVESVSLNETTLTLMPGDDHQLKAIVNPDNAANKDVTWSSSNYDVVTVENGRVTAISEGIATIKVTTIDGAKTDECTVTVSNDITKFVSAFYRGGTVNIVNGVIQPGGQFVFGVNNNAKNVSVIVKSAQLIDGVTGAEGNVMDINATINAGSNGAWTITTNVAIQSPVVKFTYTYNGNDYTAQAQYTEPSWP